MSPRDRSACRRGPRSDRARSEDWRNRCIQAASLLRVTLPCETALCFFHDVDRRRKLKGWARTWMSHHQIPRRDGDQAERCDCNLPFASCTQVWEERSKKRWKIDWGEVCSSRRGSEGGSQCVRRAQSWSWRLVCTENPVRVDGVMKLPKLAE